jgi:hypothetical protein
MVMVVSPGCSGHVIRVGAANKGYRRLWAIARYTQAVLSSSQRGSELTSHTASGKKREALSEPPQKTPPSESAYLPRIAEVHSSVMITTGVVMVMGAG